MWEEAGMKQNNKKVIVITGGIGTGKSTAVNIIRKFGYLVLDSDKIVHEGYNRGRALYYKVTEAFGSKILDKHNAINRQALGRIVFNDEKKLTMLNSIVHEYVIDTLAKGVEASEDEIVFLDIPLILESIRTKKGYGLKYDEVWLIYVNSETQAARLKQRAIIENKNPEDVLNIINKQIPIDDKLSMVDEVIINDGTIEELEGKITELFKIKGLSR